MINWFKGKKINSKQGKDDIENVDEVKYLINKIHNLSGVSKNDFKDLYVVLVERFSDYLVMPNQVDSLSGLIDALKKTILALRKRQGYLLPLVGDSEASFREREEWTYAIFSCALLNKVSNNSRFDVAKAILPKQAILWLYRNSELFKLWKACLLGENNILSNIVNANIAEKSEGLGVSGITLTQLNQGLIEKNPSKIIKNESDTVLPISEETKAIKKPELFENSVIQEVDLSTFKLKAESGDQVSAQNGRLVDFPNFTAEAFWKWLGCSLETLQISVNEPDSVVHRIDLGLFLVMPDIIDRFVDDKAKQLGVESRAAALDQRISLTKSIKKNKNILRTTEGSRIHIYCIGKWEDRHVMSGFVVKPEVVLKVSMKIPINLLLVTDPMATA